MAYLVLSTIFLVVVLVFSLMANSLPDPVMVREEDEADPTSAALAELGDSFEYLRCPNDDQSLSMTGVRHRGPMNQDDVAIPPLTNSNTFIN